VRAASKHTPDYLRYFSYPFPPGSKLSALRDVRRCDKDLQVLGRPLHGADIESARSRLTESNSYHSWSIATTPKAEVPVTTLNMRTRTRSIRQQRREQVSPWPAEIKNSVSMLVYLLSGCPWTRCNVCVDAQGLPRTFVLVSEKP
jgi:hypothetical protein